MPRTKQHQITRRLSICTRVFQFCPPLSLQHHSITPQKFSAALCTAADRADYANKEPALPGYGSGASFFSLLTKRIWLLKVRHLTFPVPAGLQRDIPYTLLSGCLKPGVLLLPAFFMISPRIARISRFWLVQLRLDTELPSPHSGAMRFSPARHPAAAGRRHHPANWCHVRAGSFMAPVELVYER